MTIRTFVVMLTLIAVVPGCRMWGWGSRQKEQDSHLVENFTNNKPNADETKDDDFVDSTTYAKKNGRTEDPGTGLSDRSRQIERSLGYK